jgi:hypothetical protein
VRRLHASCTPVQHPEGVWEGTASRHDLGAPSLGDVVLFLIAPFPIRRVPACHANQTAKAWQSCGKTLVATCLVALQEFCKPLTDLPCRCLPQEKFAVVSVEFLAVNLRSPSTHPPRSNARLVCMCFNCRSLLLGTGRCVEQRKRESAVTGRVLVLVQELVAVTVTGRPQREVTTMRGWKRVVTHTPRCSNCGSSL